MASHISGVATGETNLNIPAHTSPSKWKTYGFIIAIIAGIGALGLGGVGAFSYFHIGALSSIAQINAIIMMAVGGGCGIILLAVGIIGIIKNRRAVSNQLTKVENSGHKNTSTTESQTKVENSGHKNISTTESTQNTTHVSSTNTEKDWIYGADKWQELGKKLGLGTLKILDTIPEEPTDELAYGKIRIYIPEKISINDGEATNLTVNNLRKMKPSLFAADGSSFLITKYGDETAAGWIDIDASVSYQCNTFDTQQDMVNAKFCRLPKILEAVVLNLIDFELSNRPTTYTRCCEQVFDGSLLCPIVGGFDSKGIKILAGGKRSTFPEYGVAAVREFKSVSH